jgi:hypothetical protein
MIRSHEFAAQLPHEQIEFKLPAEVTLLTVSADAERADQLADAMFGRPFAQLLRRDNAMPGDAHMAFSPLVLNWNTGNFHFTLSQSIFAPTGSYDINRVVNLGRNYWAFDTGLAFTWLDPQRGHEISASTGFLFNTTNTATSYHTGSEFHLDFLLAQYFSESFAVGFNGYWYRQMSGDSGVGATLGPFRGESVGIGPALIWRPRIRSAQINIVGKWLHDVEATNRFSGDMAYLSAAFKF